MKRLYIKIFGQVQGINFRIFVKRQAENLGLTGWVKNTPDNTVEAVFEGEEEALKKMLDLCYQGPSFSRVDKIDKQRGEATDEFHEFEIRY